MESFPDKNTLAQMYSIKEGFVMEPNITFSDVPYTLSMELVSISCDLRFAWIITTSPIR